MKVRIFALCALVVSFLLSSCGGGDEATRSAAQNGLRSKQSADAPIPAPVLTGNWQPLPNPNYAPPAGPYVRDWTEMLWDPVRQEVVIYGGNGVQEYENDIWSYNETTTNWTNLSPYTFCPGNNGFSAPNGTDDTAFKYDPVNNLYWAFGNASGYRCLTYSTVRTAATGTTISTIVDPSLAGAAANAYAGWQVLVGSTYVTVSSFDATSNTLSLSTPIAGLAAGSSYQLYATTGTGIWYYDPVAQTWTGQNTPPGYTGPTPTLARIAPAVAYSTAAKSFVLFSGWSGGADNSVWVLDVTTKKWTQMPVPATGAPPSMTEMLNSFVYDSVNDVFILFGGSCNYDPVCPNQTLNGQTWVYKLSTNTWTAMNPPTSPAAREQQVMAFDSTNGVTVLYGGVTGPGVIANDTWYYHYPSNTWTQLAPATSPPARYLAQVAYNPVSQRTIVFGGQGATSARADIWALTLAKSNAPPAVSLTSPTEGSNFAAPATISLAASASSSGSTISNVAFYAGTTLIGQVQSAPYAMSWANVPAGSYTLTAVATDATGASTTSAPVNITVAASVNVPPTVSLTSPMSGGSYTAPATITVTANAASTTSTVAKVDFYNGSVLLGESTAAPYSMTWNNVAAGSYTLTAVATDATGASTTSAPVTISVAAPVSSPPTVSLSSPAGGSNYTAPASITLAASAASNGSTISNVQFFAGTTSLGVAYVAPYSVTWSSVPAGTYTFTAVATDANGASTTSAPVSVTVTNSTGTAQPVNVALQANGGVATASSQYDSLHQPSAVNNGVRNGAGLGQGGVWTDGTPSRWPDWIQISFNGPQTINQVNVFTLADNFTNGADPTPTQTFTLYGITNYEVQYWTGSAWTDVPGGSVTSNNLVWRNFSFPALTTTAIRVLIHGSATSLSFVTEVEAWTPGTQTGAPPTVSLTAPAAGSSYTAPATIAMAATASSTSSTIAKVDFYSGTAMIGEATAAPYTFTWSNVPAGSYTLTAVATDASGASTTSAPTTVSVAAPVNVAPSVSLTAPASGSNYTAPASIALAASASSTTSTIARVDFYAAGSLLGTATAAPYTLNWNSVAAGSYALTAVATDATGASTSSTPVTISVSSPVVNVPPTVSLTSPASGSNYTAPASIALAASATSTTSTIARVDFYAAGNLVGSATAAPYALNWSNVAAGSYALTAVATDATGASTSSAPVTISVASPVVNVPPAVTLTSPVTGSSYSAPATIALTASASSSTSTISKVEFFSGATSLGVSYVAPYSLTWNSVPAGTYAFTAVATDATGASTTSPSVSVTVTSSTTTPPVNVALKANGGLATASSQYDSVHPASAVIDGVRNGAGLGQGGVWTDGTPSRWPDWIQVSFSGAKTINQINVVTLGDNFATGAEPAVGQTFTLYGITNFNVQYWTGSAWATVPGGAIASNNLVITSIAFPPLTTTAIRVVINGAATTLSFVTEVEAWTASQ